MKNFQVVFEIQFEVETLDEAREFARRLADLVLDEGAHRVNATGVADVTR